MKIALSFAALLFQLTGASSAVPQGIDGDTWQKTVERATRSEQPIVIFAVGSDCRSESCAELPRLLAHPAMQRRLRSVSHVLTRPESKTGWVTVTDPKGKLIARWDVVPTLKTLRVLLTMIDHAKPNIVASHVALAEDRPEGHVKELVQALFTLGFEDEGRQKLSSMLNAESPASAEVASIWLARLDWLTRAVVPNEGTFTRLATDGASSEVKFEAWMLIGEIRARDDRMAEASVAFREALDVADNPTNRKIARRVLMDSFRDERPVLGLGAPGAIVAGSKIIQPVSTPAGTSRVEYRLGGKLVGSSDSRPFVASIDFGSTPERNVLGIVALDEGGGVLKRSTVLINGGGGSLGVAIREPSGWSVEGRTEVVLDVSIPLGRRVQSVELSWNGSPVSVLETPPYTATFDAGQSGEIGILAAKVRLEDGSSAEDARVFNGGEQSLASDVHLVEVPVYGGRKSLRASDITLIENGKPGIVDRVVGPDSPLSVTLLLDMSDSMLFQLLNLEEAALRFVEKSLGEDDTASVIAFDARARVALWPSTEKRDAERAILDLGSGGGTALYDAIIAALMMDPPPGSRRAIIVLSDGVDNASLFEMPDVIEVARRRAIPIYVLLINPITRRQIAANPPRGKTIEKNQDQLRRVARSSGGRTIELNSMRRLDAYWEAIADDLSNQSLVVYRPAASGGDWRELEISVEGGGRLRAPSGVSVGYESQELAP